MFYQDIPILMYHEISGKNNSKYNDNEQNNPWCVSSAEFEKQMLYLKKAGYKTISLAELKEGVEANKETTEKFVVLTFDDARKGVYDLAFPVLKKFSFTATIFVVSEWIEGRALEGKTNYSPFMSWKELKELAGNGFEIGAHTLTHRSLINLNETELIKEIIESKKIIEEKTGQIVNSFSYPYGKYNEQILKIVNENYNTSVTIVHGFGKQKGEYSRQWILRDTSLETFAKLLSPPKLSLCMIVKNEEQFLEQCLLSVQGLVDEIIIVDTGSTDKTKEIAAKFTSSENIYDFQWCDDFSAARNFSLQKATCDWILILDADEVLAESDKIKIKEALNDWDILNYQLMTRNYSSASNMSGWQPNLENNLLNKDFSGWFPSLKVRLFQNKKNIFFSGVMHELVEKSIESIQNKKENQKSRTAFLAVPIHHYGELKSNQEEKKKWHLQLTEKKIAAAPHDAKAYFELGVQYKELGKLELAEKAFQHSLELDPNQIVPLLNLALVQQKQNKFPEAKENYNLVLQRNKLLESNNNSNNKNNNSAESYFGLGFCFFKENNLEEAASNFQQAILNKPNYIDAYINLGAIYEKQNKLKEALNILNTALTFFPQHPRAYYNSGVIWEKLLNLEKALDCYQKALEYGYGGNSVKREELGKRIERMKSIIQGI